MGACLSPFEIELFLRQLYGLADGKMAIDPAADPAGLVCAEAATQENFLEICAAAAYGLCVLKRSLERDLGPSAFIYADILEEALRRLHRAAALEELQELLAVVKGRVFNAVYVAERGAIARR